MDDVRVAQRSISEREREILVLVAQGFTNAEIGECLSITRLTVRTHLENIYAKLCVRDRTQAVVRYFFFAESEKIIHAYLKWCNERNKSERVLGKSMTR
jgi:DNA-binding CsgD family transcriptional regulator